jgi:hypothetical protein
MGCRTRKSRAFLRLLRNGSRSASVDVMIRKGEKRAPHAFSPHGPSGNGEPLHTGGPQSIYRFEAPFRCSSNRPTHPTVIV